MLSSYHSFRCSIEEWYGFDVGSGMLNRLQLGDCPLMSNATASEFSNTC